MLLSFLCDLCALSYESLESIKEKTKYTKENIDIINVKNTKILILEKSDIIIFVFTGSNDPLDFKDNINVVKTPFNVNSVSGGEPKNFGCVHNGFLNYYNRIRGEISEHIEKFAKKNVFSKTVCFLGHSLGGSCVLGAVEFAHLYPSINFISRVFGSPKIGDRKFNSEMSKILNKNQKGSANSASSASSANLDFLNIINKRDPIPYLPLFFTRNKPVKSLNLNMTLCEELQIRRQIINGNIKNIITDHSIYMYLYLLQKEDPLRN